MLYTIALGFFLDFSALCGGALGGSPGRWITAVGDRVSCGAEHASERTGY